VRKWLKIVLSVLFTIGVIAILFMVDTYQRRSIVPKPTVTIEPGIQNAFLDEEEVLRRLSYAGLIYQGQRFEELNTSKISKLLKSISQVKNVNVYRSFGTNWNIDLELREPIARIYNQRGESFYLDSEGHRMFTTPQFTAHVLVVNGAINDAATGLSVSEIINNDSLKSIRKLDDIYRISNYVCNDPLMHSLIGQLHLEKDGDFILIPIVGDQKIVFGSAFNDKDVSEKFNKLKIFYEEAMPVEGWEAYSEINLKYKDQIVCKKKAITNTSE
jgi:cell division protein FtsQ